MNDTKSERLSAQARRSPEEAWRIAARLTRIMLENPRNGAPPPIEQIAAAQALLQMASGRYLPDEHTAKVLVDVQMYLDRAAEDDETAPRAVTLMVNWGLL